MKVKYKSKEDLQEQVKGFLDFADKTGKITEKQKEKLSKILGISDSEKKGFFEWLSKRVGNWIYDEVKIGKKLTQGNLLHRGLEKYIDKKHDLGIYGGYSYTELDKDIYEKGYITRGFDSLLREYSYYLRSKKYFEKYKTSSDIVNYKFIDHLSSRCSSVDYYKKHQDDHSYYNDRNYYKREFLKESEKYKIFKENFDILMNSGVHKQVDWITAIEDNDWHFYRMDEILDEANPINLKIFLDKYPNIDIKTLLDHFDDSFFKEVKNENLCILFQKFPGIDIKVLYDYEFGLKYKLKDSDFKNYIIKLLDFYPNITLDEFLWVCKNISIEKLLLCNNIDDFLELICKKYDFKFDNYKTVFNHYNCLFTDRIKREGYYCTSTDFEKLLEYGNIESIKMILNKYHDIKLENLIIFSAANPESLKLIFEKYTEITIDELKLLENRDENKCVSVLSWSNPKILRLIFEKYPEITIDELKLLENRDENKCVSVLSWSNPKILRLIFEKYPEITIEELKGLESNDENKSVHVLSGSHPEILKLIFEKYPKITVDELKLLENISENKYVQVFSGSNPKSLKLIFEKYPEITVNELALLESRSNQNRYYQSNPESLELLFKYFEPLDLTVLIESKALTFQGTLPKDIVFKENNHKGYLKYIDEIIDTSYSNDKKSKMIKKVVSLSFELAENYLKIFKMLDESISMDIQRVKNELIDNILDSDNPGETAETIVGIFERNNLPLTGKIFKVFELLYPIEKFKTILRPASAGSPVLNDYIEKGKENDVYNLIYRDLMNIAINSGDRSLREFLKVFIGSEELLRTFEGIINKEGFNPNDDNCLEGKFDEENREKDEEMQAQLLYLFRKIAVLYNKYLGKEIYEDKKIEKLNDEDGESIVTDSQLVRFYCEIKKGFNVKGNDHSLYDKLKTLLYINGLKFHSPEEVLDKMDESKKQAHERGLKLYNEAVGGKIDFPKHAFLKGVDEDSFSKIINRGITSREYLGGGDDGKDSWGEGGSGAGSDCTPFDIDGLCVSNPVNHRTRYGLINLIVDTDRGNFVNTNIDDNPNGLAGYQENQYELFKTGGGVHYGIRTGIPTTEIDYIIYHGSFNRTQNVFVPTEEHPEGEYIETFSKFQNMCYEIARNGYYIPIVDVNGKIKFTPEMYHKIRAGFNYMEYYDGYDVELTDGKYISRTSDNTVNKTYNGDNEKIKDSDLGELISENSPKNEKYQKFAEENRELAENTIKRIKKILKLRCGIEFNPKFDSSITGAELHDTGSTGRGTDIPTKDVDLDFTLLLDAKDYERIDEIKRIIHEEIGTQNKNDYDVGELGNQIKSKINNIGKSDERKNGVPLDLLILKKSQVIDYSSSDAMKEKLDYIESIPQTGSDDLERVRTNVIIMKKLLKAKSCYKHPEGGFAGIGVENWITQHHGSFIEALESFEEVAYGGKYEEGKQPLPLEDFKEKYPIYDAGENYKFGCNDNFVYQIDKNGGDCAYQRILQIVKTLRLEGINGIRKIIKEEYEENKKKYTC